jgi:Rrf2 family protein
MRLTRLCRYALKALAYLARHEGGGFVPVDAIADAEGLPAPFLPKALGRLVAARVVLTSRGPRGGYRLAHPARPITLLDVVEAVDGPIRGEAPRVGNEATAGLDDRLQEVCDDVAELVRRQLWQVGLADLAGGGE